MITERSWNLEERKSKIMTMQEKALSANRPEYDKVIDVIYICKGRSLSTAVDSPHAFQRSWLIKSSEKVSQQAPCPIHKGLEGSLARGTVVAGI